MAETPTSVYINTAVVALVAGGLGVSGLLAPQQSALFLLSPNTANEARDPNLALMGYGLVGAGALSIAAMYVFVLLGGLMSRGFVVMAAQLRTVLSAVLFAGCFASGLSLEMSVAASLLDFATGVHLLWVLYGGGWPKPPRSSKGKKDKPRLPTRYGGHLYNLVYLVLLVWVLASPASLVRLSLAGLQAALPSFLPGVSADALVPLVGLDSSTMAAIAPARIGMLLLWVPGFYHAHCGVKSAPVSVATRLLAGLLLAAAGFLAAQRLQAGGAAEAAQFATWFGALLGAPALLSSLIDGLWLASAPSMKDKLT